MHARFALRTILAGLFLLTMQAIRGEPPASRVDEPARTDRYGDPLPDGAIARLGTVRLRHSGFITAAAFSPDGKTLAEGDFCFGVRLWDVATGKEIAERRLPNPFIIHPVRALAFTADGDKITVVDAPGYIHQWEPSAGKQVVLGKAEDGLQQVRFSSDGETLAHLTRDRMQVHLRQRATSKLVRNWKSDKYQYRMLSFSPDGKILAAGSEDGKIHLLDVGAGAERRAFSWNPERSSFNFSPDGKVLVWWSMTETAIHFCDPATGEEVRTWKNPKTVRLVDYSSDGKQLAVLDTEGTIRLLNSATGEELRAWKGGGSFLFSPDGKLMAAATSGQSLQIWETATGKPLRPEVGHTGAVRALAFSPDGKIVASAIMPGENSIRLWDAATGRPLGSCADYGDGALTLAFSPDGKTLASGGIYKAIRLWDAATGRPLRELSGHPGGVVALIFSPDGKLLSSAGNDDTARLWDLASGKEVRHFALHKGVQSFAFALDGKSLATSEDKVIHLWDVAKGQEIRQFRAEGMKNDVMAISPRGQFLASGNAPGNSLVLWDMSTGKVVHRLTGPEKDGILSAIVFSPDGKTMAVGDSRQFPSEQVERIHLWNTATGRSRGTFRAPPGGVASLAFSPDGKILAAGNEDTTILLWDMTRLAAKP